MLISSTVAIVLLSTFAANQINDLPNMIKNIPFMSYNSFSFAIILGYFLKEHENTFKIVKSLFVNLANKAKTIVSHFFDLIYHYLLQMNVQNLYTVRV